MRAVLVVEGFIPAQGVEEVTLVPDQGPVQEFAAAGLYPALHERVHPWYPNAGRDDLETGIGHQGVEGGCELRVAVSDQEPCPAARVLEVHEEVASELHDPVPGRMRGDTEDPDATGGVLDDGEDIQARPCQRSDFEEIAGEKGLDLAAQEVGPGGALPFGCGWDAVLAEYPPDRGGGDLDPQRGELAVNPAIPPRGILPGQTQDHGAD